MLGTFRSSGPNNIIEVGIQSIPIVGYRRRVIKGILNRLFRKKTVDLNLLNITIVKGFYINIVLEALLHKKGL